MVDEKELKRSPVFNEVQFFSKRRRALYQLCYTRKCGHEGGFVALDCSIFLYLQYTQGSQLAYMMLTLLNQLLAGW